MGCPSLPLRTKPVLPASTADVKSPDSVSARVNVLLPPRAGALATVNPCSSPDGPFTYHSTSAPRRYSTLLPLACGCAVPTARSFSPLPYASSLNDQLAAAPLFTLTPWRVNSACKLDCGSLSWKPLGM